MPKITSILITTNQDFEVVDYEMLTEVIEKTEFKYYNAQAEYFDAELATKIIKHIKILHENSEEKFKEKLQSKKEVALRASPDMRKFKWMEYYDFLRTYADVKYAYAITAHKSQGSTYKNVILLADDISLNRKTVERNRILYTAVSRAQKKLFILTKR